MDISQLRRVERDIVSSVEGVAVGSRVILTGTFVEKAGAHFVQKAQQLHHQPLEVEAVIAVHGKGRAVRIKGLGMLFPGEYVVAWEVDAHD